MAHAGKDTGGSQFFICHSPQGPPGPKHTVFGQVTSGLEVVDKIQPGDKMTRVWVGVTGVDRLARRCQKHGFHPVSFAKWLMQATA